MNKAIARLFAYSHITTPPDEVRIAWLWRLCVVALAAVLTVGCGGGSDELSEPLPAPTPATPTALAFKVMPARARLAEGTEGSLSVFGANSTVTWTSSDPAVVQVDTAGVVKALARGSATITATEGAKASSATVKVWRSEGANADPSTESLIAAAMAAGRLSAEEALIYRVYALFGDERLPTAYDGAPDSRAAVSLRQVSGQLPALSPATQEILRPFLIPPIYADSWFGRQWGWLPRRRLRSPVVLAPCNMARRRSARKRS